jgi:8-oxo-dGTP pyrophosphatase MutT (NUDIX family)
MFVLVTSLKSLLRPVCFGVMGAIMDDQGRVLLVRQTYMPGWRLPGGGVGRGEPPDIAVRRELEEELGLCGGEVTFLGLYTGRAGIATHLVSLYRITGAAIAFKPNLEVREILYADPANPPPGTVPSSLRRLRELCGAAARSQFW